MDRGKKVIVFGGSGFLGSHVADSLTKRGFDVTIFDIKESENIKKNFGENRKILTLLDDKGNLIDYECNQKENLQKNFLLEEN